MDRTSRAEKYIVVPNSPIEFAISGPAGGRDRILVKSENAGLDLIGLAAQPGSESHRKSSSDLLSAVLGKTRQLNFVTSFPLDDIDRDSDSRSSKFGFAWQGYASQLGMEKVQKTLNLQLPEMHRAIRNKDLQEIEWALAPLIYRCTEANERRLRSRRMLLVFFGLYLVAALMSFLYLYFQNVIRR